MKLVTPEQMRAIDASTINDYGIPGLILMEDAAMAVTSEASAILDGCKGRKIVLLCGTGNNGGDAFAAARLLHCKGAEVSIYLIGRKEQVSGDAHTNLAILEKIGLEVIELNGESAVEDKEINEKDINRKNIYGEDLNRLWGDMGKARLIIDGIFGTGLSRPISGYAEMVIKMANASEKPILSIDIPSGIDGKCGGIKGSVIKADATVTFCMPKTGLVNNPGCEYTGRLIVADIGIPACAIDRHNICNELIDAEMLLRLIPNRKANSNKGDYGRALFVTGSTGMTGSGCLASIAALRSGAGLAYVGVPKGLVNIYGAALTEPILLPLENDENCILAAGSAEQILGHMKRMSVAAIGPGLTAAADVAEIIEKVISRSAIPLVLDADALNAISANTGVLKKLTVSAVVTPHPGEMARLTGLSIGEVQSDRMGVAKRFAKEYGVVTVLKGSRTVVAQPDGRVFINPTGNAGMASAGTGDVLTGIITGLIAQGAAAGDASIAGVYLHGLAGDFASEEKGMHSVLASDLIEYLPQAFKRCSETKVEDGGYYGL